MNFTPRELVPLLGYAPDADQNIAGVLTNCAGVVPSLKGFKGAPSPASTQQSVLASTCMGAATLTKLDGTSRFFAGAATKLYEASSNAWTDVSRSVAYSTPATGRWRFAQQGNVSFAVNGADTVQASVSSGAFSCIGGAPIASIVETVGKFVFAVNTSSNSSGIQWAALGDYTSWATSISTQAGSDSVTTTPGGITAARKFGNAIVIYKGRSMYLGVYVGPPNIWQFELIPGNAGALSQEVVLNIGTPDNPKHIFMGYDDFFVYDGSRPVPIGTNRVKETVLGQLLQSRYYVSQGLHDRQNNRVYFYYTTTDSNLPNKCVVYNYRTDRWGVDDRQIEIATDWASPGVTWDNLGTLYSTWDSLPNATWDQAFLNSAQTQPAVFDVNHSLKTLTGAAGNTSITTGDLGDDGQGFTLNRLRPRFLTAPTTATLTNYYKMNSGDSLTTDAMNSLSNGKFDVLRDARWHRFQIAMTGDWEATGLVPEGEVSGLE